MARSNNNNKLKAFVRFDGSGRIVPSSLIVQAFKPKVGNYKQIDAKECCNPTPTTTSTTTLVAAVCETLGGAANFSVLAGAYINNTGPTIITGDLGLYPGTSVTGFPPGSILGVQHITDTSAANAINDAWTAWDCLFALAADVSIPSVIASGTTLTPGVYDFVSGNATISASLELDGQGDPNALFVFKINQTFTVQDAAFIDLINGTQSCNIYWVVGGSTTIGVGSLMMGNILSVFGITMSTNSIISTGRAISLTGNVTMTNNQITNCNCTINPCPTTISTTTAGPTTTTTTTPGIVPSRYEVSAEGSVAYIINGGSNPTLSLTEGEVYSFVINAPGHPFWIKTVSGTGTGNQYNTGVTNNGIDSGTITFIVPVGAPSTLYYNCQYHASMAGIINITS